MKKLLIILGILLILTIVGVWAYLFTYGKPENADEIFTRFGFGGNDPLPEIIVERDETIDVDGETPVGTPEKLKQLTTRPVGGATFTATGILYVEEGTGHVYHIDLGNGEEKLLSGTTIPGARDAVFGENGTYVAITSTIGGVSKTLVGFVDTLAGKLTGVSLPSGAREVQFGSATNTVLYLLPGKTGSTGYSYDIEKGAGAELFTIPLRDVRVLWGNPTYVYTTPSVNTSGHLYRLEGSSLKYVSRERVGLMGLPYKDGVIITANTSAGVSSLLQTSGGTSTPLSLPLIPEKCTNVPDVSTLYYCGMPSDLSTQDFPDTWYKGAMSYSDNLMGVDVETNEWFFYSDFLKESGREIDISKIGTDEFGDRVYFINKNDNTLWMFDMTL